MYLYMTHVFVFFNVYFKGKFHTFCEMGEKVSAAAYYAEELNFAATELEYCIKVRYRHD